MFHSLVRTAPVSAVLFALAACSAPKPDTAPRYAVPEPTRPDPSLAAKEAEYREYLAAGRQALEAKDVPNAITHLERATTANPKGADAHLALAQAFIAANDSEKAIRAFGAALDLNPRSPDAALERAGLLEKAGRLEDAASEYTRLIGQDTDRKTTAKAYWLRGGLADRLGKRSDFRYDREQALKLDPSYESRVTAGDVIVHNYTDYAITVTLDRVTAADGSERTFPNGLKFPFAESSSAYLAEGTRPITAKAVRVTVTVGDRSKSYTAAYEHGMSLEVRLFAEHLPVR